MVIVHQRIPVGFGQNTGRSDACYLGISTHHAGMRNGVMWDKIMSVDPQMRGNCTQIIYGTMHGLHGRLKNVDVINLFITTTKY